MSNELSIEQKKMVKNMGALSYSPSQISAIMDLDESDIRTKLADPSTEFFKIYNEGEKFAEYLIDLKLFEMAQSGDIKAIDKLEKRKKGNASPESNKDDNQITFKF